MNLDARIEVSKVVIQRALSEHPPSKCAVACSFGKDSMAVLHLVRQFEPNVLVVFCNTGVEYPQTLRFRDQIVKEWNLNYFEARPEKGITFWSIVKQYGLPTTRKAKGKDAKSSSGRIPRCCIQLKEKPGMKAYKDHNIELCFTGITAMESHNRAMLRGRCGDYYFAKIQGLWKCHPIMSWTEAEVYEYHKENAIPLNPLYTEFPGVRVGCMPCTSYLKWPEVMAKTTPKLYRYIQKMRGQQLIDEVS